MIMLLFTYLSLIAAVGAQYDCEFLTDPLVFDPLFYLNAHADLAASDFTTIEQAKDHWCSDGINEGRQGTSPFHSLQYLERYEDLEEAFGQNYTQAINHYITQGYAEGRIGYLEGGGHGRWTVRSTNQVDGSHVYISTSERTGGAVDSLVWKNKEFINNFDHGRQLQLALTVPPYGECWNPTEAGGRSDGTSDTTMSIIQEIQAGANRLYTTNHPAYWFRAGSTASIESGSGCQVGDTAKNELDTHPFPLSKNVTIGCFGMDNCLEWNMSAHLGSGYGQPTDYGYAQLEGPTAYCMADFIAAKRWNYETDELTDILEDNGEEVWPVIIMTPDGDYAIAAYAHPREDLHIELRYAYINFNIQPYSHATYKWSVVWRDDKQPDEYMDHQSWTCVGNLDMVHDCLRNVRAGVLASLL